MTGWLQQIAVLLPALPPDGAQLAALGALVLVALALSGLGGLVGGAHRLPEADLAVGWGLLTALVTLVGTTTPLAFTPLAATALTGSMAGFALRMRRGEPLLPPGAGRALALALPLLLVTLTMTGSQWDEFTQWLHSVRYLVTYDVFPGGDRPPSGAILPAYPYALPLVGYLVSRVAGGFVENAVALFNLLLLGCLALAIARLMQAALDGRDAAVADRPGGAAPRTATLAVALLAVTILSPSFVPKLVLTAYAETGTAVTVALAGLLGWAALERLGAADRRGAWRLALRMGLVLAVLVALKQATLALFGLVLGGVALAALRRADVGWRDGARVVALGAVPGLVVWLAWRLYVARALPGQEFAMLAPAQWNWPLLPGTLRAMGRVALGKAGHFGLMLAIALVAARALLRAPGQGRGGLESLAVIAAVVMVGYNLFLLFTYLAVFQGWESEHAASYWRYNTHVGAIGLAVAVPAAAHLWRRTVLLRLGGRGRRVAVGMLVALLAVGPLLGLAHLRFDLQPMKRFARGIGETLSRVMPPEARLVVVNAGDPGFYPLFVNYLLDGHGTVIGGLSSVTPDPVGTLRRLVEAQHATHLLALSDDPAIAAVTGIAPPADSAVLLAREPGGAWVLRQRWPIPVAEIRASRIK